MPYSCVSLPELEQAERKKITRAQKVLEASITFQFTFLIVSRLIPSTI